MSNIVCVICSNKNAENLINIDTGQLRDLYDLVCGIKTQLINHLPSYICKQCVSHLSKFYNLQSQFKSGLQTTQELSSQIKQNPDNNYVIDRSEVSINPVLSLADPEKMKLIKVKHQPYSMLSLKPQNQTRIPSFHIEINNKDDDHVNKTKCKIKENQPESVQQNDFIRNWHIPTENVKDTECFILVNNSLNLKIEVEDKSLAETTLASLAKIIPISKMFRSIERYMVVKLLTDNEMKAVNEVVAHIRNRKLEDEEKNKICETCLLYVTGDMDSHKKKHEEESANVCSICFLSYSCSTTLTQHYIKHHLFKYACRICEEVFFMFSDARTHLTKVHKKSLKELGEVNEDRDTAYSNLESHFDRAPCSTYEAIKIMMRPYKRVSENFISCSVCKKKIKNNPAVLKKHQDKHVLLPGQVQCEVCKYVFGSKYKLRRHYSYFHYWKYSCKECDYVTTMSNLACSHKLYHLRKGDLNVHKCEYCDRVFKKTTTLATHTRYAHPCNAVCNICGEAYATEKGVKRHKRLTHTEEERTLGHLADLNRDKSSELYCKECDLLFIHKNGCDKHLQSSGKHTAVNEEYRNQMRKIQVGLMKRRRKREAAEKKERQGNKPKTIQKCHICGAEVKGITTARIHYRKFHPDDPYYLEHLRKEYKCDLCAFKTYHQSGVYIHKKMSHSSLRPFKCPHCDATFKSKSNMQRHISVHTDERLYECEHCHKCFKQKITCQLHIQTVHLKIPYLPWINKNKKKREKISNRSEKTTNKRKYSNEVKQEVVQEGNSFYLEAQESATEYIIKDNLVYSTTSSEMSNRARVVILNTST